MKITIKSANSKNKDTLVEFRCSVGIAAGVWKGPESPIVNGEYSIEIDIDKTLDEIHHAVIPKPEYKVMLKDKQVYLFGEIEDVENDGMCYFRLADDSLIMIEGGETKIKTGQYLMMELNIYDIEIFV